MQSNELLFHLHPDLCNIKNLYNFANRLFSESTMIWYLVVLVIILLLFLQMEWLKYPLRNVPGPPTAPILGNLIQADSRPAGNF